MYSFRFVLLAQDKGRGPWRHHGDFDTLDQAREAREKLIETDQVDATRIRHLELHQDHVWSQDVVDYIVREMFRGTTR